MSIKCVAQRLAQCKFSKKCSIVVSFSSHSNTGVGISVYFRDEPGLKGELV